MTAPAGRVEDLPACRLCMSWRRLNDRRGMCWHPDVMRPVGQDDACDAYQCRIIVVRRDNGTGGSV